MGFKNFCCNCCAWFSVIGCATFGVLAMMLYRRNPAVLEHKFHLKETDETEINARMTVMLNMQIVMIVAALACFMGASRYAKIEADEEEQEIRNRAIKIDKIFVNDAMEEQRRSMVQEAARRSSVVQPANQYAIN